MLSAACAAMGWPCVVSWITSLSTATVLVRVPVLACSKSNVFCVILLLPLLRTSSKRWPFFHQQPAAAYLLLREDRFSRCFYNFYSDKAGGGGVARLVFSQVFAFAGASRRAACLVAVWQGVSMWQEGSVVASGGS